MRLIEITRQLDAADQDGIAQAQTTGGAGNLTLNGAFVVDGVAILDQQRHVGLTSAGDDSGVNFTITGTDQQGRAISETIAGPNATTVTTTLNFLTVTQIAVDAAVGVNVEAGTVATGASQEIPLDQYISPFNVSMGIEIDPADTVSVTLQYTFDDVFGSDAPGPFTWINHPDLTAIVATSDGTFISPVTACRLLTNSGVDPAILRVAQAGLT